MLAFAVHLFLWGCSGELTELVVVVDTDLNVPSEADELRLIVDASALGDPPLDAQADLTGANAAELPATLGVVHQGGALGPITVTAQGLLGGAVVIERQARVYFVPGTTVSLRLELLRECVDVSCPADQSCARGGCRAIDIESSDLPPWSSDSLSRCPGAVELCNGVDDDCDGLVDEQDAVCPLVGVHVESVECQDGRCLLTCEPGYFDCDELASNGCESQLLDEQNCGACGELCAVPRGRTSCASGSCLLTICQQHWYDCNGELGDGCESQLSDLTNCGTCGLVCELSNALEVCREGRCEMVACQFPWDNCDARLENGCETNLQADIFNCGACNIRCPDAPSRARAQCDGHCGFQCDIGWSDCDYDESNGCETPLSRPETCGDCSTRCTGVNYLCSGTPESGFSCVPPPCPGHLTRCGSSCVDTRTSGDHCGSCDVACPDRPWSTAVCRDSRCDSECDTHRGDCDDSPYNGCETLLNTIENCGECGFSCLSGDDVASCLDGECAYNGCPPGWDNCDGDDETGCETEVRTATDCGRCDLPCPPVGAESVAAANCDSGRCVITECIAGWEDRNGDPADGCELRLDCLADRDCDDELLCTIDGCSGENVCIFLPDDSRCNDEVACTNDVCDENAGCRFTPDNGNCDDSVACTNDVCDENSGCQFTADDGNCDDEVSCTDDLCDEEVGCQFVANDGNCDDEVACTNDVCDEVRGCLFNANDGNCDDEVACTNDLCDETMGCLFVADHGNCDDEVACTNDVCDEIQGCQFVADNGNCNDGVACTNDVCDEIRGCQFVADDGNCDDSVACTHNVCDEADGCLFTADDWQCDDEVACTVDVCDEDLGCLFTADDGNCDDEVACTNDVCDEDLGCLFTADDGNCDDEVACTNDVCDEDLGCLFTADDGNCDDEVACTNDVCDEDLGCLFTADDGNCDDEVACTNDVCDEDLGCLFTADDGNCDDGVSCTTDKCDDSADCVYTAQDALCDDGIACTVDSCDSDSGCASVPNDSACPGSDDRCDADIGCAHVLWVDRSCSSAGTCGTGTQDAPFPTIAAALAATVADATVNLIRVASGSYNENQSEYNTAGSPVVVLADGPVKWSSSDRTPLRVLGSASFEVRGMSMAGSGAGIMCEEDSQCSLVDVVLNGSTYYGVLAKNQAEVSLDRCVVMSSGTAGVRMEDAVKLSAVNSLFFRNGLAGTEAGAIHSVGVGGTINLTNCTIADNGTGALAGAIRVDDGATMSLKNLLLWGNAKISGVECQGCTLGSDSLRGVDPVFVVEDGSRTVVDDYRIQSSSPARDIGLTGSGIPSVDFWGASRDDSDGFIDAGADEF